MDLSSTTIGFLGAGNMGSAMIQGILKMPNAPVLSVCDHHLDKVKHLIDKKAIRCADTPKQLIQQVSVIVIAVKPQSVLSVFRDLQDFDQSKRPVIVSIVAGLTTKQIRHHLSLGEDYPIIRMMPNTPGLIQAGMTGLYVPSGITQSIKPMAEYLGLALGDLEWVDTEDQMDAITALSGSGPAYFFQFLESLIKAGQLVGFSEKTAKKLAIQTGLGALTMALQSEEPLHQLCQNVTSKGGTTEAGLSAFHEYHLDDMIAKVIRRAYDRSKELSTSLD